MFKKTAFFAAALIGPASLFGLAATSTPAAAAEKTQVLVHYSDLDLSTQEGQNELQVRLNRAARKACGLQQPTFGSRALNPSGHICLKEATKKFEDQIAEAVETQGSYVRYGG